MLEQSITIINKLGLHARAATKFVNQASSFISTVEISKGEKTVNGKSIMGVMMLAAGKGTELMLKIDGEDEQEALQAITALVNNRFDEAE